jgi:hypothetical protein
MYIRTGWLSGPPLVFGDVELFGELGGQYLADVLASSAGGILFRPV